MKILFITNGWPPESLGGVEVYARRLAIELAKNHTVSIFCRETDESRPDYDVRHFDDGPVKVTAANYNFGDLVNFVGTYFNRKMGDLFQEFLDERDKPDVVHIHHLGGLSHSFLEILSDKKIPVALTQHDFALTCPRGQRVRDDYSICESLSVEKCLDCLKPQCHGHISGASKLYRYLFRKQLGRDQLKDFWSSSEKVANRSGMIFAPSEYHAKKLADDGLPSEKIRVMEYGYDVAVAGKSQRGEIGLARKFGFLGALIPSKGVHILLQAFGKLCKDLPDTPLELHLHGPSPTYHGNNEYPAALKQMAGKNPVTFHGQYAPDELPEILMGLDAVVVPSVWWETHGIVVREAKLAGLPVVVSDHGAVGEAITDGVNGLKFRPGNFKHLRDKMYILAKTPGLADKIASNTLPVKTIAQDAADHEKAYREIIDIQ